MCVLSWSKKTFKKQLGSGYSIHPQHITLDECIYSTSELISRIGSVNRSCLYIVYIIMDTFILLLLLEKRMIYCSTQTDRYSEAKLK